MNEENRELAARLEILAAALDFAGESTHRVGAFRRAAASLREAAAPVRRLRRVPGGLRALPGAGPSTVAAIESLLETGRLARLEEALERVPPGLRPLLGEPALDARVLGRLHRSLGVEDAESAIASLRSFRHRGGEVSDAEARRLLAAAAGASRVRLEIPLEDAIELGRAMRDLLETVRPGLTVFETGDLRRRVPGVGEISLLALAGSADAAGILEAFLGLERVRTPLSAEPGRAAAVLQDGCRVSLRTAPPEAGATSLLVATGPAAHLDALESAAQDAGAVLREEGLFRNGRRVVAADEDGLYRALGFEPVPPELRRGADELERAARGEKFPLVSREDLRWDPGLVPASSQALEETVRVLLREGASAAGVFCADRPGEPPGAGGLRRRMLRAAAPRFPAGALLETGPDIEGAPGARLFLPPWDRGCEERMIEHRLRGGRAAVGSGASSPRERDRIEGGVALLRRAGYGPEDVLPGPPDPPR